MKKKWVAGAGLIKLISLALAGLLCAGMGAARRNRYRRKNSGYTSFARGDHQ